MTSIEPVVLDEDLSGVARMEGGSSPHPHPHAASTPKEEASDSSPCRLRWIWVMGLLVLALLIGVAGGVIGGYIVKKSDISSGDKGGPKPDGDGAYIDSISEEELHGFLVDISPLGEVDVSDPGSPQSKAFQWLLEDLNSPHTYPSSDLSKLQRYALATLYFATNGHGWDLINLHGECELGVPGCDSVKQKWMSLYHECDWSRVYCDAGQTVTMLRLNDLGLNGMMPSEISLLKESLVTFEAAENYISGTMPAELTLMTKLQRLSLTRNRISGHIPTTFGRLNHLVDLCLGENALTGSIPTELGLLTDISALDLKGNMLHGKIPSELGLLPFIKQLELFGNYFSEEVIPSELCNLPNLQYPNTDCGETEKVVCCCCEMCCNMELGGYGCSRFNPCDPDEYNDISEMTDACDVCFLY